HRDLHFKVRRVIAFFFKRSRVAKILFGNVTGFYSRRAEKHDCVFDAKMAKARSRFKIFGKDTYQSPVSAVQEFRVVISLQRLKIIIIWHPKLFPSSVGATREAHTPETHDYTKFRY